MKLKNILTDSRFLLLIFLINVLAGVFSFSYYLWQFELIPLWLWVFVADCPVYALLFALNVFLLLKGKSNPFLAFVSVTGSLKFGLWTILVLFASGSAFVFWTVVIAHVLLAIETIVFFKKFEFKPQHLIFSVLWFLFNDFLDYFIGIHPFVQEGYLIYAGVAAVMLSLVVPLLVFSVFSKKV